MNTNATSVLQKGIAALQHVPEATVHLLNMRDAALMLATLPADPALFGLRRCIGDYVNAKATPVWVRTADPHEVFLGLFALAHYQNTLAQGERLANAVQRLIAAEVAVGGPYALVHNKATIGANALAAAFLQKMTLPLPKMKAFLQTNATAADPALTSDGVAVALLLAGKSLPITTTGQQHNGLWPAHAFFAAAPSPPIVTTAVMLGCLVHTSSTSTVYPRRQNRVIHAVREIFSAYPEPLRSAAHVLARRMHTADATYEITLLPYFFSQAIPNNTLTATQVHTLCVANVCGWMAYTVYDAILDTDAGPSQLPIANCALRESLAQFKQALPNEWFQRHVATAFTTMDHANAWELSHCRFAVQDNTITIGRLPQYGRRRMLAARAVAHTLGPLAVLATTVPGSTRRAQIALNHYLIARQLNDDLHDWQDDLAAGHASYVITALLRSLRIQPGTYTLGTLLPTMQKQFYTRDMEKICHQAITHAKTARRMLSMLYPMRAGNRVDAIVDYIAYVAEQSLTLRSHCNDFIKAYETL